MMNYDIKIENLCKEQSYQKEQITDDLLAEDQNCFKLYQCPQQFFQSTNANQLMIDEDYQQYMNVDLGVPQGQSSILSQEGKLFKKLSQAPIKDQIQTQKIQHLAQGQQAPITFSNKNQQEDFETSVTKNLFTIKTKRIDKNTLMNFPKYLIRLLIKEIKSYEKNLSSQQLNLLKPLFNRLFRLKYKSRQFNTELLQEFLSDNESVQPTLKASIRKIMRIILQKSKKEKILENKHLQKKKDHLVLSKIYNLRCLSSSLIGNVQIN